MTAVKINSFGGEVPRMSDRLLRSNFAAAAKNCELLDGELKGFREPQVVKNLQSFGSTLKSAFRVTDDDGSEAWLPFDSTDANVIRGPLVNDAYRRYYWSEPGQPLTYNSFARIDNGDANYKLGVPAPVTAPTLTANSGSGDTETRSYVYTFVNEWGEESQPSPPVLSTEYIDANWVLSDMEFAAFSSEYNPKTTMKIYRTVTGQSSSSFYLVEEISVSSTYVDTKESTEVVLNPILESTYWAAPSENLQSLVAMPNGYLAAFSGRDLFFGEAYRPHAWPVEYIVSTQHDIVALAVYNNALIILTKSEPYVAFGNSPASFSLVKSDVVEPCLSAASVVTTESGVFYASPNGLVLTTGNGFANITTKLIRRNEWQSQYLPSQIKAAQYGKTYLSFRDTSNGFSFDPSETLGFLVQLDRFLDVENVQTDPYNGDVYLIKNNLVYRWNPNATDQLAYTWKSKVFELQRETNLGAYRIKFVTDDEVRGTDSLAEETDFNTARIADPLNTINLAPVNAVRTETIADYFGPQNKTAVGGSPLFQLLAVAGTGLVFNVYADGVKKYSAVVEDERTHKLPSGFKACTWQFECVGNTTIYSIEVAETGKELMTV